MVTRDRSALASFSNLSPNNSKRDKPIRRLTPHCVAGNLTAKATLGLSSFKQYNPKSGASCTYAIGSDGTIGLGVPEYKRPWTTSSRVNDNEAITFEISNDGAGPDWHMSDEAINAWLDLAEDICNFYGYKKVAYYGSKDILGSSDEMIITLHRWFANKACPGEYFVRQIPWLVKELNTRLNGGAPTKFVEEGVPTITPSEPPVSTFEPYLVKINTPALNVRTGPGSNYDRVRVLVNDKNVYTITEEAPGPGASKWGKLKSGIGYISLDYVKKV